MKINKIGIPYLGCGLGRIKKEDFKSQLIKLDNQHPTIEYYLINYE